MNLKRILTFTLAICMSLFVSVAMAEKGGKSDKSDKSAKHSQKSDKSDKSSKRSKKSKKSSKGGGHCKSDKSGKGHKKKRGRGHRDCDDDGGGEEPVVYACTEDSFPNSWADSIIAEGEDSIVASFTGNTCADTTDGFFPPQLDVQFGGFVFECSLSNFSQGPRQSSENPPTEWYPSEVSYTSCLLRD